jgi:hypothetical protein
MALRYTGIHRRQLFHWIGQHIEHRGAASGGRKAPLGDAQRGAYLDCLCSVLERGKGLWVKAPREPDRLGDGSLLAVTRPICCFTEWALDESLPHTARYGRLGLGFSKQFVLQSGGQPVTYVRDRARKDPFVRAMRTLAMHVRALPASRESTELASSFEYVSQFLKRVDRPKPPVVMKKAARLKRAPVAAPRASEPHRRRFGRTLAYLEEREWRIVFDPAIADRFRDGPGTPAHYLPFRPGSELFTVVLPDTRTVHMALHDRWLRKRLLPVDAPHVTVLALDDVGTF